MNFEKFAPPLNQTRTKKKAPRLLDADILRMNVNSTQKVNSTYKKYGNIFVLFYSKKVPAQHRTL